MDISLLGRHLVSSELDKMRSGTLFVLEDVRKTDNGCKVFFQNGQRMSRFLSIFVVCLLKNGQESVILKLQKLGTTNFIQLVVYILLAVPETYIWLRNPDILGRLQ